MCYLNNFEKLLKGGHPNSLGDVLFVVEEILQNNHKIEELYECYFSEDEVVRLRVSNSFKRSAKQKPEIFVPFLDKFIDKISQINQASTQWTFAQLFFFLDNFVSNEQREKVTLILQSNLTNSNDWIVLNTTMETLFLYSQKNEELKAWLNSKLEKLTKDNRKSVAKRAQSYLNKF